MTDPGAIARRQAGDDVVVCGAGFVANFRKAQDIENAVGPCKHHPRHPRRGPNSLAHFQQQSGLPAGHTFYEQPPTFMAL